MVVLLIALRDWRALFNHCGAAGGEDLVGKFGVVDGAREHESANAQRHRRNRAVTINMFANHVDQAAQTLLEDCARWTADAGDLRGKRGHGTSLPGIVAKGLAEISGGESADPVGALEIRKAL